MKTKFIALLLAFSMVLCLCPAVFAAEDEAADEYAATKAALLEENATLMAGSNAYIKNESVAASVAYNGQYTLGKSNSSRDYDDTLLLYGHPSPGTSTTTIRVGYKVGNEVEYANYLFHAYAYGPEKVGDNEIVTSGKFPVPGLYAVNENGEDVLNSRGERVQQTITVTQHLKLEKNYNSGKEDVVAIRYEYENPTEETVYVGVRIMMDTMLGDNDGAPFRVAGEAVTYEKEFKGSEIPQYWQAFDNLENPKVVANGTFFFEESERPDLAQFVYWSTIYGSTDLWNYAVSEGRMATWDSAVAVYFNPRTVPASSSGSVVTYYGLSDLIIDRLGNLNVSVSAPASMEVSPNGGYYNNPFTVTVNLQNAGNAPLNGVTATLTSEAGLVVQGASTYDIGTMSNRADDLSNTKNVSWTVRAVPQIESDVDDESDVDVKLTVSLTMDGAATDTLTKEVSVSLPKMDEANAKRTVTFVDESNDYSKTVNVLIGDSVGVPDDYEAGEGFTGWYANPKCYGDTWFDAESNSLPITANLTLYAGYNQDYTGHQYVLTFKADDSDDIIVLVNKDEIIPADKIPAVPPKPGYIGTWDRDLSTPVTQDMIINAAYQKVTPVTSVTFSVESLTMIKDDTVALVATVLPENADDKSLTWEVNAEGKGVVEVDQDGNITAIGPGKAVVKAISESNPEKVAECKITVLGITGLKIVGLPEDGTMKVGDKVDVSVEFEPAGAGTDVDIDWSITDTRILKFEAEELVTKVVAKAPGTAVVQVMTPDGIYSDRVEITVIPEKTLKGIHLEGYEGLATETGGVENGDGLVLPAEFKVIAEYDNGAKEDVTKLAVIGDYHVLTPMEVANGDYNAKKDPSDSNKYCSIQKISVTYAETYAEDSVEVSAEFDLYVKLPVQVVGITTSKRPNRRVYLAGESLDLTGLVVNVHYNTGKTDTIEIGNFNSTDPDDFVGVSLVESGLKVTGYDPYLAGVQEVKISYGENPFFEGAGDAWKNYTTILVKVLPNPLIKYELMRNNKVLLPEYEIRNTQGGKIVYITAKVDSGIADGVTDLQGNIMDDLDSELDNAAEIWYTLDGSIPARGNSTSLKYDPIRGVILKDSYTLKAVAYRFAQGEGDDTHSLVQSARISVPRCATPTFDFPDGTVFNEPTLVHISCATPGAEIRFKYVSDDPLNERPIEQNFRDGDEFLVDRSLVIQAYAVKDGYLTSSLNQAGYVAPLPITENVFFSLGRAVTQNDMKATVPLLVTMDRQEVEQDDLVVKSGVKSFSVSFTYSTSLMNFKAFAKSDNISGTINVTIADAEKEGYETVTVNYWSVDDKTVDTSGTFCELTFLTKVDSYDKYVPLTFDKEEFGLSTNSVRTVTTHFSDGTVRLKGTDNSQPYLSGDISIVSEEGKDITSVTDIQPGSNISQKIVLDEESIQSVKNVGVGGDPVASVHVWMAVYNKQGMLLTVQSWDLNLTDLEGVMSSRVLNIPQDLTNIGSIKTMITSDKMAPLMLSTNFN